MLKRDIVLLLTGSMASAVFSLGTQIVLARTFGAGARGVLALALLIPMILNMLCGLGQESVNATFAGLYKDKRNALFVQSWITSVLAGVVSFVVLSAFFFWLPIERGEFAQVGPFKVWASMLLTPCAVTASVLVALVRGVGQTARAALFGSAQAVALFICTLVFVVGLNMGLDGAVLVWSLAPLISVFLSLRVLRHHVSFRPREFSGALLRQSLGFGLTASMANFAMYLTYRSNQGILGYMVSVEQLGLYVVAVSLAERLRMLPDAISSAFLSRLANEFDARRGQVPMVFRCTLLLMLAGFFVAGLLGIPAIPLLFGREFTHAVPSFLILLPGIALLGGDSVLCSALMALGKPKYAMWTSWLALLLNVGANLALIPILGIAGAALASTIAYAASAVVMAWCYLHEVRLPASVFVPTTADFRFLSATLRSIIAAGLRRVRSAA
jgi:O-antigen/teichoic acid export membrane protein